MKKIYTLKRDKKNSNDAGDLTPKTPVINYCNTSFSPYTGSYYNCLAQSSIDPANTQNTSSFSVQNGMSPTALGVSLAREYRFSNSFTDPLGMWTGNPTDGPNEKPIQDADDL